MNSKKITFHLSLKSLELAKKRAEVFGFSDQINFVKVTPRNFPILFLY